MKKLLLSVLFAAAALTVSAGPQPDAVLNGGTNTVPPLTTNYYAGTVFYAGNSSEIILGAEYICTNANNQIALSGGTFTFACSMDQAYWKSNAISMWVGPTSSSNVCVGVTNLVAGQRYPFWRLDQIWNTNNAGTNLWGINVGAFTKTGL